MELNGNDLYYEITTTNVKDSMLYILKYNNGLFQISGNYFSNKMDVIHELIYEDYYVLYIEYGSDTDHEESGLIYENNFTSVAINRM
jgi:hypothetical protein